MLNMESVFASSNAGEQKTLYPWASVLSNFVLIFRYLKTILFDFFSPLLFFSVTEFLSLSI